jgi:hypothetical protein
MAKIPYKDQDESLAASLATRFSQFSGILPRRL